MRDFSTTNYYNAYWKHRDEWMPNPAWTPFERQRLTRFVAPESIALDVGCGSGEAYGRFLAQAAKEYHGLDISAHSVETACRHGIRAQLQDLQTPFPFPDQTFDRVLCIEVLEHLFDPAFTLGEIWRVVKPSGQILLSVPNIAHFSNRLRAVLGGFAPGGTPETSSRRPWADPHIRFFTSRTLRWFVAEQKLEVLEIHGEGFSLFSTLPVVNPLAARLVGWERLEQWSKPFEFMAHLWPSRCAGHLFVIARPRSG